MSALPLRFSRFRLLMLLLALAIVLPALGWMCRDWALLGPCSPLNFDLVYLAAVFAAVGFATRKPLKLLALAVAGSALTFGLYTVLRDIRCPGGGLNAFVWPDFLVHSLMLTGLLVILFALSDGLAAGIRRLLKRLGRPHKSRPTRLAVLAARLALLYLVAIPWLFVFLQTHRPKINYPERPVGQYSETRLAGLCVWHEPPATQPANVVVLLCHGIEADQGCMHFYREMFHEMGCDVVSLDLPGHGQSAGNVSTFGVRESEAIAEVAKFAKRLTADSTGREPVLIGLGLSMGGASLLLAAERDPGLFDGLIVDSAYARLADVAEFQLGRIPAVAAWPMRTVGPLFIAAELGTPIGNVDAIRDIRKLDGVPKLFIQGDADKIVPIDQGRALFAAAGGNKRMIEFPGVGHVQLIVMESPTYRLAVRDLLSSVRRARAPDRSSLVVQCRQHGSE
jgi:pimeloyl-ACP methyl ester carboxylesterase